MLKYVRKIFFIFSYLFLFWVLFVIFIITDKFLNFLESAFNLKSQYLPYKDRQFESIEEGTLRSNKL